MTSSSSRGAQTSWPRRHEQHLARSLPWNPPYPVSTWLHHVDALPLVLGEDRFEDRFREHALQLFVCEVDAELQRVEVTSGHAKRESARAGRGSGVTCGCGHLLERVELKALKSEDVDGANEKPRLPTGKHE